MDHTPPLPLTVTHGPRQAHVSFDRRVDPHSIADLVETLRHLITNLHYRQIELQLLSPGGDVAPLYYYIDAVQHWQDQGIKFNTRALTDVASASAIMLSLGDDRTASSHSRLLHHHSRLPTGTAITAKRAFSIARTLQHEDDRILDLLVARAFAIPVDSWEARCHMWNHLEAEATEATDNLAPPQVITAYNSFRQHFHADPTKFHEAYDDYSRRLGPALKAYDEAQCALEDAALPHVPDPEDLTERLVEARDALLDVENGWKSCLKELYRQVCDTDEQIPPELAIAVGLLDRIHADASGDDPRNSSDSEPAMTVQQWRPLFPDAKVPYHELTRHFMILGETGSGKTKSGVLPVVEAIVSSRKPVSCALIIDPKREISAQVGRMSNRDAHIELLDPDLFVINAMAAQPEGDVFKQATQILRRIASLTTVNDAVVLLGKTPKARDVYWPLQSTAIAITALALVLLLLRYGEPLTQSALFAEWSRNPIDRVQPTDPDQPDDAPSDAMIDDHYFTQEIGRFFKKAEENCSNASALAEHVLKHTMGAAGISRWEQWLERAQVGEQGEPDRLAALDDVRKWARIAATSRDTAHYVSIVASGTMCFFEFAQPEMEKLVYFGVEPGWRVPREEKQRQRMEFGEHLKAVNKPTRVFVYQPHLQNLDLVARTLKARFFESILNDEARQKPDHKEPLVAYVADEFHRFITGDKVHGEQSFLDACRSFGVFCILATQSISSMKYALLDLESNQEKVAAAVSMLSTNTGNKLFFRTTDQATKEWARSLAPTSPRWGNVVDARPLSSLRPGECFAVLANARIARAQLDPWKPSEGPADGPEDHS